jgi:glycerol-3-phosphate dehydrogenase (NAD(P)+)
MSRIAILGAGAWGTALAINLLDPRGRVGEHQVTLWTRSEAAAAAMRESRENRDYLPGFPLPLELRVTSDEAAALAGAEIVVSVVPSEHLRAVYERFSGHLREGQLLVSATKGIEDWTLLRMSEVIAEITRRSGLRLAIGALSGPSFAQEVAAGSPTALTIASSWQAEFRRSSAARACGCIQTRTWWAWSLAGR